MRYYELTQEQYSTIPHSHSPFSAHGLFHNGMWYIWEDVANLPYYDWLLDSIKSFPLVEIEFPEATDEEIN